MSVAFTSPAEGQQNKSKKAAASAKPASGGEGPGRTPGSGSCDNAKNKCSGSGETCRDNLCYCQTPEWARCTPFKPGDDDTKDCAYLSDDANNCGACGHKCSARAECEKGKCNACKAGQTACPGKRFDANGYRDGVDARLRSCVSLQDDEDNCGKCNHECPDDWSCVHGHCEP